MKKVKILRIVLIILIILWALLIFSLSNQVGSESSGLSRKIVEIFFNEPEEFMDIAELGVRKLAHFSEYGLGGILFISLFSTYNWTDKRKISTATSLGVWYAALDEIHQLMVDGRNGTIRDVWIDSLGFTTGIVFALIIIKSINLIKVKRLNTSINNK